MIHSSPYPPIALTDDCLPKVFLQACDRHGNAQALISAGTGRVVSYAELASRVRSLAACLANAGLKKGEVVALIAGNSVSYPIVLHAVLLAGGVVTTLNPLCTGQDIQRQLADAHATWVIASPEAVDRVRQACSGLPPLRLHEIGSNAFEAMQHAGASFAPGWINAADDLAVLPYSSGTSGLPKGVMLTHRNLVANARQSLATFATDERDTVLAALPFFHIYGMVLIMTVSLLRGDRLVVVEQATAPDLVAIMEKHRVTLAYLVPPLVLFLARNPVVSQHDLASLRDVVCGAAPLDPALADECAARLDCDISQGYGMTETSPVVANGSRLPRALKGHSVGTLVANTEVRLIDPETLQDVPPGEPGEIVIRGPQVMKGYLGRPQETAAALLPDGWLRTGDIGHVDPQGHLHVVDRIKELVKYKGYQVAPSELEGYLLQHPCVRDAAVIPVPDLEAGEVPKAFVVLKPQASATGDELMAFVAERVIHYKKLRRVEFVEAIPKSPSGKILRRVLVELERERAGANPA